MKKRDACRTLKGPLKILIYIELGTMDCIPLIQHRKLELDAGTLYHLDLDS